MSVDLDILSKNRIWKHKDDRNGYRGILQCITFKSFCSFTGCGYLEKMIYFYGSWF